MSEKDSNTEQEFPEVPPFPFDNELELLKKKVKAAPDAVKQVLEQLLQEQWRMDL